MDCRVCAAPLRDVFRHQVLRKVDIASIETFARSLHLFTDRPVNAPLFRLFARWRWSRWLSRMPKARMQSRTWADSERQAVVPQVARNGQRSKAAAAGYDLPPGLGS